MSEAQTVEQTIPYDEMSVLLTDEKITDITDALQAEDADIVHSFLADATASDTAELIAKIDEDKKQILLGSYLEHIDPEAFIEMDLELRRHVLESLAPEDIATLISKLESDDALEMISHLDEGRQHQVMKKLSWKMRLAVTEGLSYPEESAGRLMQREVVVLPQFWTVGNAIDYLRAAADTLPEDFFDIFVVTPAYHLAGQIPLNRLVRAPRDEKLENLTLDSVHPIPAHLDQEEVAHIFRREGTASAPVVNEDSRLMGVITVDDIIDVIDEEVQEDILSLVGVDQGDLYRAVLSTTGKRFRWLFVNLLTAILASVVISFFNATIEQIVALAVLMPIVASMGGNAGTQALTVAVRALATRELSKTNSWRIISKEVLVGSLNGIAFAVISGLVTTLWFSSPMLGLVIAVAMIVNLFVAGLSGAGIPLIISRFGGDPAVSSTVFLTTITDVVGFFVFLGLAALVLL